MPCRQCLVCSTRNVSDVIEKSLCLYGLLYFQDKPDIFGSFTPGDVYIKTGLNPMIKDMQRAKIFMVAKQATSFKHLRMDNELNK